MKRKVLGIFVFGMCALSLTVTVLAPNWGKAKNIFDGQYKVAVINATDHAIDVKVSYGGITGQIKRYGIPSQGEIVVEGRLADCLNNSPIQVKPHGDPVWRAIRADKGLTSCGDNTITIHAEKLVSGAHHYYFN